MYHTELKETSRSCSDGAQFLQAHQVFPTKVEADMRFSSKQTLRQTRSKSKWVVALTTVSTIYLKFT